MWNTRNDRIERRKKMPKQIFDIGVAENIGNIYVVGGLVDCTNMIVSNTDTLIYKIDSD